MVYKALILFTTLGFIWPIAFVMAQQIDCSPLDPRASISKEMEGKVQASVNTLYRIAKVSGSLEAKMKEEIQNLQIGSSVSEQGIIKLRTLYLFCGMVANAKDLSTEKKVELFKVMMDIRGPDEPKSLQPRQKKDSGVSQPKKSVTTTKNGQEKVVTPKLEPFKRGVFGILVSAFKGTTQDQKAKGNQMQGTIVSTLNARFAELGIQPAEARGIPSKLSSELNSHRDAMKIGKEYGASMVIWGDITIAGVIPNITILGPIREFSMIINPETTLLKDTLTHISLSESREIRLPALTQEPTTIVCFATAFKYYSENKLEKALEFFKAALPDNPTKYIDSAPIFFYMGNIMYLKDEHDKAIAFYTKTLELNPLHTMALNNRGASHTKQMHAEQALSDFNQTLKIDPDHPLALNNRG
jgi:hypothetical protein